MNGIYSSIFIAEDWYFVASAGETHDVAETSPDREDEELFSKNEVCL